MADGRAVIQSSSSPLTDRSDLPEIIRHCDLHKQLLRPESTLVQPQTSRGAYSFCLTAKRNRPIPLRFLADRPRQNHRRISLALRREGCVGSILRRYQGRDEAGEPPSRERSRARTQHGRRTRTYVQPSSASKTNHGSPTNLDHRETPSTIAAFVLILLPPSHRIVPHRTESHRNAALVVVPTLSMLCRPALSRAQVRPETY